MYSLVVVLFLSVMTAKIMLQARHKDIACYNQMDSVVCETFDVSLVAGKQKDLS